MFFHYLLPWITCCSNSFSCVHIFYIILHTKTCSEDSAGSSTECGRSLYADLTGTATFDLLVGINSAFLASYSLISSSETSITDFKAKVSRFSSSEFSLESFFACETWLTSLQLLVCVEWACDTAGALSSTLLAGSAYFCNKSITLLLI